MSLKRLFFVLIINFLFLEINSLDTDNSYKADKEKAYLRRVRNNSVSEMKDGLFLVNENAFSQGLETQIKAARDLGKKGSEEAVEILAEAARAPFIRPVSFEKIISTLSTGEVSLSKAAEEVKKIIALLPQPYRKNIESFVNFQYLLEQMHTGEIPPKQAGSELRNFLTATGPEGTTVLGGVEVPRGESSGVDLDWLKEVIEKFEHNKYYSFESLTPVYYAAQDIRMALTGDPELIFWKKNEDFTLLLSQMEKQEISPEQAKEKLGRFLKDAQEFLIKLKELAFNLEKESITSVQAVTQIEEILRDKRFSFWGENERLKAMLSSWKDGKLDNQEAAEEMRHYFTTHLTFPLPVSEAVLESLGEIASHTSASGALLAKQKLLAMLKQYYQFSLETHGRLLLYRADWNPRLREIAFKALGKIDDPEVIEIINFALTGEKLTPTGRRYIPSPEECRETELGLVGLLINLLAEKSPSQAINSIKLIFSRHYQIELPALIYTHPPAGWRKGEEAFWFRGNKVELLYDNSFYDHEREGFINLKLVAVEALDKIAKAHPELRPQVLLVLDYILSQEKSAKRKVVGLGERMVINEKDVELYKDAPPRYKKVHIMVFQDSELMKKVEEIKKRLESP